MVLETAQGYLTQLKAYRPDPSAWDWEATPERSYSRFLPRGARVIDIGGHAGRHAQVFVEKLGAGQVWIFEPLPAQFKVLQGLFGHCDNVELFNKAASSSEGSTTFVVNMQAPEESGLLRRHYNDEAGAIVEEIEVTVNRLDAERSLL